MNNAQKMIVVIGATVIALMGLYPPWVRVEPDKPSHPMGYGFLWDPPTELQGERANLFGNELQVELGPVRANRIDWSRLLMQWAVVSVVTGAGVAIAGTRRPAGTNTRPRQHTRV